MNPRWLVARGDITHKVAATQQSHLFTVLQRSAMHWCWIFAPNKEAAINEYNNLHST